MREYKIVEPMPQYGKDVARIVYVPDEMIKQIRADAIDEIIEYYKPCNNCCACLEDDRDYFKKKCEMDMQISYTELVEYLEQLKEKTMNNENNFNLTEMIREIHEVRE